MTTPSGAATTTTGTATRPQRPGRAAGIPSRASASRSPTPVWTPYRSSSACGAPTRTASAPANRRCSKWCSRIPCGAYATASRAASRRRSATWASTARCASPASWAPRRTSRSPTARSSRSGFRTTRTKSRSTSNPPCAWAACRPTSRGTGGCAIRFRASYDRNFQQTSLYLRKQNPLLWRRTPGATCPKSTKSTTTTAVPTRARPCAATASSSSSCRSYSWPFRRSITASTASRRSTTSCCRPTATPYRTT